MAILTGVAGQAVVLVSGVLAARMLGPEDRGNVALLALIPAILIQLGGAGLPLAATYEIARDIRSTRAIVEALVRPFAVQVVALLLLHWLILYAVFHDAEAYVHTAAVLTAGLVPVQLAGTYALAILQGQRRYKPFNAFRIATNAMYTALLVCVFVVDEGTLSVVIGAWVAAMTVMSLAAGLVARSGLSTWDRDRQPAPPVREMLRFGTRGVLGSVSPLDQYRLDQAVVGLFLSPLALGYYVVGVAFSNLPRFIAQSVGMVAYPHIAGLLDVRAMRRSIWRFFALTMVVCTGVIGVLLASVGVLIPFFFGEAFSRSVDLTRLLLIATLLFCGRRALADGMRGAGYPVVGTVAEVVSWVALAPLILLLAPAHGVEGVGISMVLASAVSLLVAIAGVLRLTHSTSVERRAVREPA